MNYLPDTHVLLWALSGDSKLSEKASKVISDPSNRISISIVSFWEIAIKCSIHKLSLNYSIEEIFEEVEKLGWTVSPISQAAIVSLSALPFHHKDPFDRLILAEAIEKGESIITTDASFVQYQVSVVW